MGNLSRSSRRSVMADVALRARVSHQTVSRVLNGHPYVKAETRRRVLAAIEELDYRRSRPARALVTQRMQTLGVVVFDTALYGPANTVVGIEQEARDAGYFVSIVSLNAMTKDNVKEAFSHLADQSVDGLIVLAPQVSAVETFIDLLRGTPAVGIEAGDTAAVPVVGADQVAGAAAATRHLLELGHRTVWQVAGPVERLEAEGRIRGWRSTLEAAGRAVPELIQGDWSARSGFDAGRRLARRDDVTAVFAANDQMALGLLRAFGEAGVRVPDDVSIVGFDDIPEAEFFSPPLTTIRQDFVEVGRRTVQALLHQLDDSATGTRPPARDIVPVRLVVRRSTCPPRGPF